MGQLDFMLFGICSLSVYFCNSVMEYTIYVVCNNSPKWSLISWNNEVDIAAVSQQSTLDLIHHMTPNEAFMFNNKWKR